MTLPMAAWRATYTPGDWLVLSGPTMLVVMLPAPARMSGLVNALWTDVVAARSVDGLLELLTSYGLDNMPDFAAFFWDASGLHGLARGRIKVVDTDTGDVAVDGADVVTWREESLGSVRHLRVDMEPVDQDAVLQLPLVVGAVTASAIYLTTDEDSQVRFPDYEQLGILPKVPVLGVRPRDARRAVGAADAPADAAQIEPEQSTSAPVSAPEAEPLPPTEPDPAPDAVPLEVPVAPEAADSVDSVESADPRLDPALEPAPAPEPSPLPDPDAFGTGELAFDTTVQPGSAQPAFGTHSSPIPPPAPTPPAPVVQPPVVPPHPPAPQPSAPSAPVVVPGNFTQHEEEDDGGTVFSTDLAASHKPAAPDASPDPQVLAVPCSRGHANAPGSRHCRLCSSPVDSSNPRLIRRPALAGVHSNQGEFADIVAGVIIGRSPDTSKGPAGSHLMKVPSPSNDISRSHLLVSPRDWNIIVTDLNSTNGTTVMPVGEQPFILANGDSVQVELGTVLDLGDGASLRIEPPRG